MHTTHSSPLSQPLPSHKLVVLEISTAHASICPPVLSSPVLHVCPVLSLVGIALEISPPAHSVQLSAPETALVGGAVGPAVNPLPVQLAHHELAPVDIPVGQSLLALALLATTAVLALIAVPNGIPLHPPAFLLAVPPASLVHLPTLIVDAALSAPPVLPVCPFVEVLARVEVDSPALLEAVSLLRPPPEIQPAPVVGHQVAAEGIVAVVVHAVGVLGDAEGQRRSQLRRWSRPARADEGEESSVKPLPCLDKFGLGGEGVEGEGDVRQGDLEASRHLERFLWLS